MVKILVVDDSDSLRTNLREELAENGYEVIEASDGKEGLEVLQKNRDTKLIISDINMPQMDGISMCEEIKKSDELNKIPVIILTTQVNSKFKEKAKAAGVVAWLVKPYVKETMLKGVKRIIDKLSPN